MMTSAGALRIPLCARRGPKLVTAPAGGPGPAGGGGFGGGALPLLPFPYGSGAGRGLRCNAAAQQVRAVCVA